MIEIPVLYLALGTEYVVNMVIPHSHLSQPFHRIAYPKLDLLLPRVNM